MENSNQHGEGPSKRGTMAIDVRGLNKTYGRGSSALHVLQDLKMQVPQGVIYGLLGPSGCGKTTLLRCCLGRLNFNSGIVLTLGKPPNTRGHGVPGAMVGYMPQETALYDQFTISETLNYFGTIFHLRGEELENRKTFLIELLRLPHKKSLIKNLSGGQKRRVSFAAALLQEPELLILDEPTVGVDPLLREKIWEYLLSFAKGGKTTIILTTHYIEEARQADMVGLMRNGKLLSESSPQALMDLHQTPTLEEVFLKLCMADVQEDDNLIDPPEGHAGVQSAFTAEDDTSKLLNDDKLEKGHLSNHSNYDSDDEIFVKYEKPPFRCLDFFPSFLNLWALIVKDLIKMVRTPGALAFQFLIPAIEICLFCLCVGVDPKNLRIAVVNEDVTLFRNESLSNRYLSYLNNVTIIQVPADNYSVALENAQNGDYWGVMHFKESYSKDLSRRFLPFVLNATLEGSKIDVRLDESNVQIAVSLQQEMLNSYEDFLTDFFKELQLNPELGQIPVDFGKPIFGDQNDNFTDFMAPGVILTIVFFLAVGLSALTFVTERKEGLLDRSWVAGVKPSEVLLAHVWTQCIIMLVQMTSVIIFIFAVFKVPLEGNIVLIIVLTALQGLCGMAFGLCISAVCDNEVSAVQVALGSFYPIMLLSGIIWPIQGIPLPLYYISLALPQTYASETLRSVALRGWGITHPQVYLGFIITLAWNTVLLVLSEILLRLRK
ncbi:ABC transporter G family member 20 [Holothuria leucospilota]|uniref:ABC transporter G family member 20 n=1 Tax=Holothuria leucospilota TaxID=206669 RepID=A0A9Q1H443_HOLLE|nr:ABC transporter G family member 20 [Holothuria leucospilota]